MRDLTLVMHLDYDVHPEDMQVDPTDELPVLDQTSLFQTAFESLSQAFTQWHRTIPNKDAHAMSPNNFKLNVKERVDADVIWGQRGCEKGYWTGHLSVIPGLFVEKLKVGYHPTPIFGVQIGRIEDFDCYNALVFYGDNGRVYYSPSEFSCPDGYEQGWSIVNVHGGFPVDQFGAQYILDPGSIRSSVI